MSARRVFVTAFSFFLATIMVALLIAPISCEATSLTQTEDSSKVNYRTLDEKEIRILKAYFDYDYYKNNNDDLLGKIDDSYEAYFNHFITYGVFEGRDCCSYFNPSAYCAYYDDLYKTLGDNPVKYYEHYLVFGPEENRKAVTILDCVMRNITVTSLTDNSIKITPEIYYASKFFGINSYTQLAKIVYGSRDGHGVPEPNPDPGPNPTPTPTPTPQGPIVVQMVSGDTIYYYILHSENDQSVYGAYQGIGDRHDLTLVWTSSDEYSVSGDYEPTSEHAPERCSNFVVTVVYDFPSQASNEEKIQYIAGYKPGENIEINVDRSDDVTVVDLPAMPIGTDAVASVHDVTYHNVGDSFAVDASTEFSINDDGNVCVETVLSNSENSDQFGSVELEVK